MVLEYSLNGRFLQVFNVEDYEELLNLYFKETFKVMAKR
jgi:hypothetical protein